MDTDPLITVHNASVHSVAPSADSLQVETLEASGLLSLVPAALKSELPDVGPPSQTLALVCSDFAYLCVPGQPLAISVSREGGGLNVKLPTAPGCHIRISAQSAQPSSQASLHNLLRIFTASGFEVFVSGQPDALPADTDFASLASALQQSNHVASDGEPIGAEALPEGTTPLTSEDTVAETAPRWSRGIAAGFGAAATVAAIGVRAAAGAATFGVHAVGGAINARVTPRSAEPMQVSQASKDRIAAVKAASDASLRGTGALLAKVEHATGAIGSSLARRLTAPRAAAAAAPGAAPVSLQGTSPHGSMPQSVEVGGVDAGEGGATGGSFLPQGLTQGLFLVGRAGFAAANTVWEEVEAGAAGVGAAAQEHSVTFAQKRYGEEVATATGDALKAAGGLVWSAYRLNGLGLKSAVSGVAKSTAKESAKTLLK